MKGWNGRREEGNKKGRKGGRAEGRKRKGRMAGGSLRRGVRVAVCTELGNPGKLRVDKK